MEPELEKELEALISRIKRSIPDKRIYKHCNECDDFLQEEGFDMGWNACLDEVTKRLSHHFGQKIIWNQK